MTVSYLLTVLTVNALSFAILSINLGHLEIFISFTVAYLQSAVLCVISTALCNFLCELV